MKKLKNKVTEITCSSYLSSNILWIQLILCPPCVQKCFPYSYLFFFLHQKYIIYILSAYKGSSFFCHGLLESCPIILVHFTAKLYDRLVQTHFPTSPIVSWAHFYHSKTKTKARIALTHTHKTKPQINKNGSFLTRLSPLLWSEICPFSFAC